MLLRIQSHLHYTTAQPCAVLLQIEAAQTTSQTIQSHDLHIPHVTDEAVIAGVDAIGTRRWLRSGSKFTCDYTAVVNVDRPAVALASLARDPLHTMNSEATKYLMPSRYCHPEAFLDIVGNQFGTISGGAKIAAMADWIKTNFTYDIFASNAQTTAADSLAKKAGVCRDYAHVFIAMARAAAIPARFVSAYAPDVSPQDFHALTEVYLDGAWHLVDPTGMADPAATICIGVGADAADVSFMTSYGWMDLVAQSVQVTRVDVK
jgi:transglutaminase-like putative cysteine protease